jgi:putative serine protease PepD
VIAHQYFEPSVPDEPAKSAPAPPPPPRKRLGRRALATAVIAVALAGGAGSGALTTTLVTHNSTVASTTSRGTSTLVSTGSTATDSSNASAVYQAVSAGVVTITSSVTGRFGQQGQATGSGIVLDSRGDILTNFHVINGATQITVTFKDGKTAIGSVVGSDSGHDLAVIRVSVASSELHPVTLGDSGTVQVGDMVYAIGSPFGLSGTLTEGIISALNRNESSVTSSGTIGSSLSNLIQTDTPINPGNSGGPLVNSQGQVIGINQSIESPVDGSVGVGFSIPINLVKQLLPALVSGSNI